MLASWFAVVDWGLTLLRALWRGCWGFSPVVSVEVWGVGEFLFFSRNLPTLANCCVNAYECVINVVEILLCIWYCEFVIFGQENAFYVL